MNTKHCIPSALTKWLTGCVFTNFRRERSDDRKYVCCSQTEEIRAPLKTPAGEAIGSFSNDDSDDNEDVKKAIGLLRKTTTLHVHHAFLYISLPSLNDYDAKMSNYKFFEDVNKRRRISFSLSKLECGPQEINSREIRLHLPFSAKWNKRDKLWKNGNSF